MEKVNNDNVKVWKVNPETLQGYKVRRTKGGKLKATSGALDNIAVLEKYDTPTASDNKGMAYKWVITEELKSTIFEDAEYQLEKGNLEEWYTCIHKVLPYSVLKRVIREGFIQPNSTIATYGTAQHEDFISRVYLTGWELLTGWQVDGLKDIHILSYSSKDIFNLLKVYTSYAIMNQLKTEFQALKRENEYCNDFKLQGTVYGIKDMLDNLEVDTLLANMRKDLTPKEREYTKLLARYGAKALTTGKSNGVKVKRVKGNAIKELKQTCKALTEAGYLSDKQIRILADKIYR